MINDGNFSEGSRLPGEIELSKMIGVSRSTLRQALSLLKDDGIIKNLSFIRKPRDFDYIYYQSILDVLQTASKDSDINDYKVGINIKGDVDCLKYVFSTDLNTFMGKAKQIVPNVELVNNNESDFDVVFTVKNRGYDSTNFKTLITVSNKKENTESKYYVVAVNEFKEWNIEVLESKPDNW